jgi:hypothetical protein
MLLGQATTILFVFSFSIWWMSLMWLSMEIFYLSIIGFALFGRARLRINQKQISLTYELFGLKFNSPRTAPRQNISKLEWSRRRFRKGFWVNRVESEHQLIIWAGVQKYELGQKYQNNLVGFYSSITEPELEWLAHELSDWLGMPITKEELPPAGR